MGHLEWMQILSLSALMLTLGTLGALLRRSPFVLVMSLQLMLAACFIGLLACARYHFSASGQLNAIFVMTVAVVQAALGIQLAVGITRHRRAAAAAPPGEPGE